MDYIAGALELIASYLIGNKNKLGFILNFMGCATWIYIAICHSIYGLLLVVVPAMFINVRNYIKWSKK